MSSMTSFTSFMSETETSQLGARKSTKARDAPSSDPRLIHVICLMEPASVTLPIISTYGSAMLES